MLKNVRFVPGTVMENSREETYCATETARKLFLHVEYIGHQHVTPKYLAMRSCFAHYLLLYVVSGQLALQTERETNVVNTGQAMLIQTERPHLYGSIGNSETLWVHFDGAGIEPLFQYLISMNRDQHVFDLYGNAEFPARLKELEESYASGRLFPEIVVDAKLRELLGLLLVCQKSKTQEPIQETIRYITRHYQENLTLESLAKEVGLSVSRFSALFRQETGTSPYKYIMNVRLQASQKLLSNSDSSIEHIAEEVGFSNASAFIASFRKKFSITPLQYRTRIVQRNSQFE